MSVGGGWFSTLEFPHKTALLVEAEKAKKYVTRLEKLSSGKYVIFYRGLTDEEKKVRQELKRAADKTKRKAAREGNP